MNKNLNNNYYEFNKIHSKSNNNISSIIHIINKQLFSIKTQRKNRINRIIRGIKYEWKNQFIAKQSFKRLYTKVYFIKKDNNKTLKHEKYQSIIKHKKFKKLIKITQTSNSLINFDNSFFNSYNSPNLLTTIETRIDLILCQLNWANSLNEAHNLIKKGLISISLNNGSYTKLLPSQIYMIIPIGTLIKYNWKKNPHINHTSWSSSYLLQFPINNENRKNNSLNKNLNYNLNNNLNNMIGTGALLIRKPNEQEILMNLEKKAINLFNNNKNNPLNNKVFNILKNTYYLSQLIDKLRII